MMSDSILKRKSFIKRTGSVDGGNEQILKSSTSLKSKAEMLEKMAGFAGAIAKVNGITHHRSILDGHVSASEFTFDFDMQDGSKIYWHEIIRRVWNDEGQVIQEEYFNAA